MRSASDCIRDMGFSQGAMTALFTGLRLTKEPRAILAFSGALIDPESLKTEIESHVALPLAHGEVAPVVPAFRSRDTYAALRAVSVPVQVVLPRGPLSRDIRETSHITSGFRGK